MGGKLFDCVFVKIYLSRICRGREGLFVKIVKISKMKIPKEDLEGEIVEKGIEEGEGGVVEGRFDLRCFAGRSGVVGAGPLLGSLALGREGSKVVDGTDIEIFVLEGHGSGTCAEINGVPGELINEVIN